MAMGVTKAVAAITRAAATRPAGSVCAPRAGRDPTAQKVSVPDIRATGGRRVASTSKPNRPIIITFLLCLFFFSFFFFFPECPSGFYGADCRRRCLCRNEATCAKTDGRCACAEGWMGPACELGEERTHGSDALLLYRTVHITESISLHRPPTHTHQPRQRAALCVQPGGFPTCPLIPSPVGVLCDWPRGHIPPAAAAVFRHSDINHGWPGEGCFFLRFIFAFIKERDRVECMGDRGEDMQQITTGRIRTWVAAFRAIAFMVRASTRCTTGVPQPREC